MEARRAELQGMKKSAQRMAAEAVGIDEEDWDGTVESILAAEFRTGGAQKVAAQTLVLRFVEVRLVSHSTHAKLRASATPALG